MPIRVHLRIKMHRCTAYSWLQCVLNVLVLSAGMASAAETGRFVVPVSDVHTWLCSLCMKCG